MFWGFVILWAWNWSHVTFEMSSVTCACAAGTRSKASVNPSATARAGKNRMIVSILSPIQSRIAFLRALDFLAMFTGDPLRHQPLSLASKRLVFSRPLFYLCLTLCWEGGCDHGRPVSQLFCAVSADFRGRGPVLRHHRDPRHPGEDRGVTPSSPPGRDPRGRLGEPVHAACAMAASVDLGNDVPP